MHRALPIFCGFGTSEKHWLTTSFKAVLRQNRFKPLFINSLEKPLFEEASASHIKGNFPVVVVHSQGLQHFIHSKIRCKHLIILNSFVEFCSSENSEEQSHRLSLRQLQRMQFQYIKKPAEVIQHFQQQAAYSHITASKELPPNDKLKQLNWQLKALENPIDLQRLQKKVVEKCTFVLAKNDPIIPEFRSKQLMQKVQALRSCDLFTLDEAVHLSTSSHFYEISRTILKK